MTVLNYLTALSALCLATGYIDAVSSFYVRAMLQESIEAEEEIVAETIAEQMPPRIRTLEQTRQASLVLVLLIIGIIAGRNGLQQAGTFAFSLGGWIVFRYASIRAIIDWPGSLADLDAVILLPEPVHAPVWMLLLSAVALTTMGVLLIRTGALAMRRS